MSIALEIKRDVVYLCGKLSDQVFKLNALGGCAGLCLRLLLCIESVVVVCEWSINDMAALIVKSCVDDIFQFAYKLNLMWFILN